MTRREYEKLGVQTSRFGLRQQLRDQKNVEVVRGVPKSAIRRTVTCMEREAVDLQGKDLHTVLENFSAFMAAKKEERDKSMLLITELWNETSRGFRCSEKGDQRSFKSGKVEILVSSRGYIEVTVHDSTYFDLTDKKYQSVAREILKRFKLSELARKD